MLHLEFGGKNYGVIYIAILYQIIILMLFVKKFTSGNNADLGPWLPLPSANSCGVISQCPRTSEMIKYRELCISIFIENNAAVLKYHCQVERRQNTTVEFLYPRHKCLKGTSGIVETNDSYVRIVCRQCEDGFFETEDHYSPQTLNGCSYKRRRHDPQKVICEPRGPSEPDRCYCNSLDKWYSRSGLLFCGFSHPCDCINDPKCDDSSEDVLSDGRCLPKCNGVRPSNANFDCIVQRTPAEFNGSTLPKIPLSSQEDDDIVPTADHVTSTEKRGISFPIKEVLPTWACILIAVTVGLVIVFIILVVWLIMKKKGGTEFQQTTKKIEGDNISIKNSTVIYYPKPSDQSGEKLHDESVDGTDADELQVLVQK